MNLIVNLATYRACFCKSNRVYFLDMKEKLKRQASPDSWKWYKTTSLFANLMAPYTGKAKSYHTIWFLFATSSRSSLEQVATKKNHIQTIKLHQKYSIQPFPAKKTISVVSYKPLYHSHKYRHDDNYLLHTILKIMKSRRQSSKE